MVEKAITEKQLKTYPHEGVCLGAKTCGRCRDLRIVEANDEKRRTEVASLVGKKIVNADYDKTNEGSFELTLDDGRRVLFASSGDDATYTSMQIYEPEPKK